MIEHESDTFTETGQIITEYINLYYTIVFALLAIRKYWVQLRIPVDKAKKTKQEINEI